MSRQPRTQHVEPGLPHHVVVRGNNRRRLFSYPRDRLEFLRLIARSSRAVDVPLHVFSLLTNHAHLVVTPSSVATLSAFVKRFAQEYAWRRNRSRGASGKLFEERFFSKPITSDEQLATATTYVDLNAMRAGLCDAPGDHRWCTYRLHAYGRDPELPEGLWTPHPWWLALGRDDAARGASYRAIVDGVLARSVAVPYRLEAEPFDDRRPDGSCVAEGPPAGFREIAAEDESFP